MRHYPHEQEFKGPVKKNLTKRNSWWSHPPYHNNKSKGTK